jgi:hypothetical protein
MTGTTREYIVAFRADNGNICPIPTPFTPTVVRDYAERDAENMRSPNLTQGSPVRKGGEELS